jgi:hypothetical protein
MAAAVVLVGLVLAACGPDTPEAARSPATTESRPVTTTTATTGPPSPTPAAATQFAGTIAEVEPSRLPYSWRPGCPVDPADLRLLTVTHWGFDGEVKTGELVVNRKESDRVMGVLRQLFDLKFPIEKMELIDRYRGDDDLSVAANNTSAFNCRSVTGRPGTWSQHSYGWAIDINPVQNPFISSGKVSPPAGESYRDRSQPRPGMIRANDEVVKAFLSIGWEWGGYWSNPKDYQHFSLTGR